MTRFILIVLLTAIIGLTACGPSEADLSGTTVASATMATTSGIETGLETPTALGSPTLMLSVQRTDTPPASDSEDATPTSVSLTAPSPTSDLASPTPFPTSTPTTQPTATVPPTIPAAIIEVGGATLPPGFSMIKYADLIRPTSLTTDQNGRIYATSQDGTIHVFTDSDGDGRADQDTIFSYGFNIPLGITIGPDGETIYVSSNTKISTLKDTDGDLVADIATNLVSGLPVGQHQNDNLKFGPDGMLYMGIGSTCDVCVELDPRSATLMRFDPVSGQGEVIATGLRNPYDLAFHPITGDLFATDNGRDDLGLNAPHEELNLIKPGSDYGWPDCWDTGAGPGCEGTETAVAFFQPHSSANSIDFYDGDRFPPGFGSGDDQAVAYVTVLGSWLYPEVETGIARVRLTPSGSGYQSEVDWFAQWPGGMPLGLIVGQDGALYVGDYINDVIYRISYGP